MREPFKKRDMTFEGVRLTDLLEIAGAPDDAAAVYMHALDDYHVNLPLAGLRTADAVVATRAGGAPIGLTDGGPIRLVFPDGVQLGQNSDNWIWSIDRLRVR